MNQYLNKYIKAHLKSAMTVAILLMAMSLMFDIVPFIYLAVFCVLNALFLSYERYVEVPLDIELSTLFTVLMTLKHGLVWGIVTAILTKMAQMLYNSDFNMNSLFTIFEYIIAAVVASVLPFNNLIIVGLIVIVATNLYSLFIESAVLNLPHYQIAMYVGSNVLFNLLVFVCFAEIIFGVMI